MMQSISFMCIISIKNLTLAQMAKKILSREGISADIVSVDPNLTKNGCSYGLSFNCTQAYRVKSILNRASIGYSEVGGR